MIKIKGDRSGPVLRCMPLFYFHTRANGLLVTDHRGLHLRGGGRAACDHAIQCTPSLLQEYREQDNTYVSTQICDESGKTIAVIRGTVILERW
jgi:hypothetical protein